MLTNSANRMTAQVRASGIQSDMQGDEKMEERLRATEAELRAIRSFLTLVLRRPSRAVADKLHFLLLSRLAKLGRLVGRRRALRFRASALKRDPSRFVRIEEERMLREARAADAGATSAGPAVSESFVPYRVPPPISPKVKPIAFYLPQFHPFPENDEWWGKGFTEWTNVGKALPNYVGHYQPHCPIHLGYYDLRVPSIMEEQAKLAREYGIYGFSYYFYWFGGKTLMEEPLLKMLANPRVDIPFCLTWANENWTRTWSGNNKEVLIAQRHSTEDSIALLRHLATYFADPRYIRVNGCPMLLIYRADRIPDFRETVALWRAEARKLGFPGLHLVCAQTLNNDDPRTYDLDAAAEFPPHGARQVRVQDRYLVTNPDSIARIFDYDAAASDMEARPDPAYKLYRGVMLSWDNTARRQNAGTVYAGFSISRYARWLSTACRRAQSLPEDERFVFINAWNEWAEGTHLEPDRKHGFGYLQATYDVLSALEGTEPAHDDSRHPEAATG